MDQADKIKTIKKASRELHKGMKRGGPQTTPKGKKGFVRKPKHPKKDEEN